MSSGASAARNASGMKTGARGKEGKRKGGKHKGGKRKGAAASAAASARTSARDSAARLQTAQTSEAAAAGLLPAPGPAAEGGPAAPVRYNVLDKPITHPDQLAARLRAALIALCGFCFSFPHVRDCEAVDAVRQELADAGCASPETDTRTCARMIQMMLTWMIFTFSPQVSTTSIAAGSLFSADVAAAHDADDEGQGQGRGQGQQAQGEAEKEGRQDASPSTADALSEEAMAAAAAAVNAAVRAAEKAKLCGQTWVGRWSNLLFQVGLLCPWIVFEDVALPWHLVCQFKGTSFFVKAQTLRMSVAGMLMAVGLLPQMQGVDLHRLHVCAIEASAYNARLLRRQATLEGAPLHAAEGMDAPSSWLRLVAATKATYCSGDLQAAVRVLADALGGGQAQLCAFSTALNLRCKYGRKMHAACAACGRVPYMDLAEHAAPLVFCRGRVSLGLSSLGVRCRDVYCGRPCQKAHRRARILAGQSVCVAATAEAKRKTAKRKTTKRKTAECDSQQGVAV